MSSLHISVSPETIAHLGDFKVTNSLVTSLIVSLLLILLAVKVDKSKSASTKSKLRIFVEMIIEGFYDFFKQIAGKKADALFPLLFTFFIFIILSNWSGLLPGVGSIGIWEEIGHEKLLVPFLRSPSADLNTTFALAFISLITTQYLSIKALGLKGYAGRFINIKNPINFIVGILEIISEISKLLSFSFRLFGNIFAGEVLLAVMVFLIPVLVPVPFLALEVFVGFIQALVFTMLTLIFIVLATESHETENHTRHENEVGSNDLQLRGEVS